MINSTNLKNNNWQHVVLIRKSGVVFGYLDGANMLISGNSGADFNCVNNIGTRIGAVSGTTPSAFMKGFLDEIRIYNTALSTSQIKQNYIAGLNSLLASGSISKEEYDQRLNSLALN